MFDKKLLIMLIVVLVFIAIYLFLPGIEESLTRARVELYFATRDAMFLKSEVREVPREGLYRNTLEELIKGPEQSSLSRTIPEGTKMIDIEVNNGLARLDFNQALIENHWGGSTGELLTIYSIVNTMTAFDEIQHVQITVEGEEIETLAGHMYLKEPLEVNQELILEQD
ncbi:MAG TPA: GerMN domain-containing protein [Halanaerobiales bacterium]|nr:GerMN domain-containing protein [Halanaerobiales bacterium]